MYSGHKQGKGAGVTVKIVSVINYKGGVGKTTVVANLAAELAWRGERVLLIDLDPQASLTFSFLDVGVWRHNYADHKTIRNWYDAYIDQDLNLALPALIVSPREINRYVSESVNPGQVDLLCSHLSLINIDLELATRLAGAGPRQSRNNFLRLHARLRDGLESPAIQENYDYVLIDCPPNFNIVTKTAIVASDRVLIPTIPDYLSTLGISQLERHIAELVKDFNEYAGQAGALDYAPMAPSIMGVAPTMVQVYGGQPINAQATFIERIKRTGLPVFDRFIRRVNTPYGTAPQYGVPVVLGSLRGRVSQAEEELVELTTEFLSRV